MHASVCDWMPWVLSVLIEKKGLGRWRRSLCFTLNESTLAEMCGLRQSYRLEVPSKMPTNVLKPPPKKFFSEVPTLGLVDGQSRRLGAWWLSSAELLFIRSFSPPQRPGALLFQGLWEFGVRAASTFQRAAARAPPLSICVHVSDVGFCLRLEHKGMRRECQSER